MPLHTKFFSLRSINLRKVLKQCTKTITIRDEPTAAMDSNMENFVLELLNKTKESAGIFLITNRLKIAKQADSICILSDGKTQGSSTHQELINSKKLYSEMYSELSITN